MGTPHNEAAPGAFAKTVLMPGDPRSDEGVRASGVVTYELATGEIHVFRAKSDRKSVV